MPNILSSLIVRLIDQASGPARSIATALGGIRKAAADVGKGSASLTTRLGSAIERNTQRMDNMRMGLVDAVGGFYLLKSAIASPVKAAADFESAMADVRKVVDFETPAAFKKFQKSVLLMSTRLPMAAADLSSIVAAAGQAGIARGDLLKFTEMAAKVGVAFDLPAKQVGESLSKIKTGLGLTVDETQYLADAMNHLSNAQASSAADIMDVVRRVGAQAKMFGFNEIQVSAFGSAMLSAGAESEVAATSFRNMGKALAKGSAATKGQRKAYKALGLDAVKVSKRMQKDAVGTTIDVLERIAQLPDYMRASISSQLFGDEARALGPLLTNLDLLKSSLALVDDQQKYAGSSAKEYAARATTFSNNLQLFLNRIERVKVAVGNALLPALTKMMDAVAPMIDRLSELAQAYPELTAAIFGTVGALIAFRIATLGIGWTGAMIAGGLLQMAAGFTKVGTALKAIAVGTVMGGLTRLTGIAQIAGMRFGMMWKEFRKGDIGVGGLIAGTMATISRALLSVLNPVALVRGAMIALRLAVISTGIGAVLVGIAMAGMWIYNNWTGIKEMFEGFADALQRGLGPAMPILEPIVNAVKDIFDAISGLVGPLDATNEQWRAWGETMGSGVADAINAVVDGVRAIMGALDAVIEKAKAAGTWLSNMWTGGGSGPPAPGTSGIAGGKGGAVRLPARASGGPSKGPTLVGEDGPEIFNPGRQGTILPNEMLRNRGAKISAPINLALYFNGTGNPEEIAATVRRELEKAVREVFRGVYADTGMRFA